MKRKIQAWGIIGGIFFGLGFLLARLLSHAVEDDDPEEDLPTKLNFYINELQYPPFRDSSLEGIVIEREKDAPDDQLVIIGVPVSELKKRPGIYSLARCDATGTWRPAVPKDSESYTVVIEPYGEMAAIALPVSVGDQCIVLGAMKGQHFTPYRSQRLVATTSKNGLLYDYPNMPIIRILG